MIEPDEIQRHATQPIRYIASEDGSVVLIRSAFMPFEGMIEATRFTKFALNIGRTSHYYRKSDAGTLDENWRRNGIVVNLPNDAAVGRSGMTTMIGLAVDFEALSRKRVVSSLEPYTNQSVVDTIAANTMRSLFYEAEMHGGSSAFLVHGLNVFLHRLTSELSSAPDALVKPLDERRLSLVCELIETQISSDLSVGELAAAVQMSQARFAKSFKSATGLAPFAYLTARRIEHAKQLLSSGVSVTDTAFAVGYANPSKFAAAFRRYTKCSPSEWRQRN